MGTVLWFYVYSSFLKSDEKSEGDYDSDLYSTWGTWPLRIAAKPELTDLQETSFHMLLRKTLFFKLYNVIQGTWNQLEENHPNLAGLEGARLLPEWLVTNNILVLSTVLTQQVASIDCKLRNSHQT